MKNLILTESEKRNILAKYNSIEESFPSKAGVKDRISYIKKRLEDIEDIFPMIERYVETKWSPQVEMKGSLRDTHFGNERYSGRKINLDFFIDNSKMDEAQNIQKEIIEDLKNLFNLKVNMYGEPLDLNFFWKKWEKL